MKKIEFHNDREPALDETTLNTMQSNIEEAISYSSNEIEIGEWNGEKMYRKVISVPTSTFNTSSQTIDYNHGISNIDTVVNTYGKYFVGGYSRMIPTVFYNLDFCGQVMGGTSNVRFELGTGLRDLLADSDIIYVIIEYTKL